MISKAILVGQVSQYIKHAYTTAGKPVLKFQVGCKVSREKNDPLVWWEVVQFGPMADTLHKMLFKGQKVYVEGLLSMRKYQDKAGNDRTQVSVLADNIRLLSFQETQPVSATSEFAEGPTRLDSHPSAPELSNEDVPF